MGEDTNYYDLNMPEKGTLLFDGGVYYVTIYDENLNYITRGTKGSIDLDAGNYIINYDHSSAYYNSNSYHSFSLYAKELYNIELLPIIKNGSQNGHYTKFYRINMPEKGTLLFDGCVYYVNIYGSVIK
jgi:hypothetical protein